jgi:hypothetical protein
MDGGNDGPHRHAPRHELSGLAVQEVFRGKRGSLIKILWHDGLGVSLYAKRLERGRFIWPSATSGVVSISALAKSPAHVASDGGQLSSEFIEA